MGSLPFAVDDPASGEVVRGEGHPYFIAGDYSNIMFSHFSGKMCENQVSIFQFDPEHGIG